MNHSVRIARRTHNSSFILQRLDEKTEALEEETPARAGPTSRSGLARALATAAQLRNRRL